VEVVKTGEQLLIPRAVQGSRELNEVLDMHNVEYRDIPIYDVVGTLTRNAAFLDTLDYLVFVSASGVTAFFEEMRESGRSLPKHIKIACIGEITRKRLVQEYGEADVIATVNDVTGVVEAVATCAL
jgi:uroporphyrinogen III methyltransferase/synthase